MNRQLPPRKCKDRFGNKLFQRDIAVSRIEPEHRMRKIEDIVRHDARIVTGGVRLIGCMLMRGKMGIGSVEVRIVNFTERCAGFDFDPV